MRAISLLSLTAWGALASLGVAEKFTRCGVEPSESFRSLAAEMVEDEARSDFDRDSRRSILVDTYFHVVSASESGSAQVTDDMLTKQLDVLSNGYGLHGIMFTLKGISRTVNRAWATDIPDSPADLEMKKALRKGDYKTLNVYFVDELGEPDEGLLGWCPFPENVEDGSDEFFADGCAVRSGTVPGGTIAPYNLGATLTHEVGHFFGLFHTFEGGCFGVGDYIADTPREASPTEGCPKSRDSCHTGVDGSDPIHNFMDYSSDECLTEFTPGQELRMHSMWDTFRADK